MEKSGILRKMRTALEDGVNYSLVLNKEPVMDLNPLIGKEFKLEWTGKISCINCGRSLKKTFGQGFCYTCFTEAPQAGPCIIRPELCEAHEGKGRDVEWEEKHHNKPHIVYLAQTSGIKIGITRETNVPSRWIDQGARRAVAIANTPYRQLAGLLEVELKQYLSDRTDWRKMLTDERDNDDLLETRDMILSFLPEKYGEYAVPDGELYEFDYPIEKYPEKVKSLKLEDLKKIEGTLSGIRGQYLYFNGDQVINLRKYSGYEVVAGGLV
jgi:hypothetical protein